MNQKLRLSSLFALVSTAAMVDGVRTVFQPGEKLPALSDHDADALVASGAARSQHDVEAEEQDAARTEAAASAQISAARQRVRDEIASVTPPGGEAPAPGPAVNGDPNNEAAAAAHDQAATAAARQTAKVSQAAATAKASKATQKK